MGCFYLSIEINTKEAVAYLIEEPGHNSTEQKEECYSGKQGGQVSSFIHFYIASGVRLDMRYSRDILVNFLGSFVYSVT